MTTNQKLIETLKQTEAVLAEAKAQQMRFEKLMIELAEQDRRAR